MSVEETKPNDEPNYAARFAWATAAILLTMTAMTMATGSFGWMSRRFNLPSEIYGR